MRCPHCGSAEVSKRGRDERQVHRQRYQCKGCGRQFDDLSALVERRGRPFFNSYLSPPVPKPLKYANLGVNLGSERELRRVVRAGVGQYVRAAMPPNKAFSQ